MFNKKASKFLVCLSLLLLFVFLATAAEAFNYKTGPALDKTLEKHRMEIIETLASEKTALKPNHKKLGTDLLKLVNEDLILPGKNQEELKKQMQSLKQLRRSAAVNRTVYGTVDNDLVYVYIFLKPDTETHAIDSFAQEVTDRDEENHMAAAWIPISSLDTLAKLDSVRSIQTVIPPICNTGSITSEGDSIHRADLVRSLGQDGAGIKVGIISNGVDHWLDARNAGDLPANLHVLSNSVGGDEGTAMLEILHDLAPGAELYFHDCGDNFIAFNSAVDALIAAGCTVIADDISWVTQPFFEDGLIASHIASKLKQNNIIYISSAGNYAYNHYQGNYLDGGYNFHDFSNGSSVYKDLYIDIPPGDQVMIILQWDDKFGASGNDYDLCLYDENTGEIIDKSWYIQDGNGDPLEGIIYTNNTSKTVYGQIWVYKTDSAAAKTLEMYIYPDYNSVLYINNLTQEDSIYGQQAVPNVISVGAIDVPNQDEIAFYSSQGPVTIKYPRAETRNKPDICGMANVHITGAGGFYNPFSGTSAAVPHIAAIAALVWAENPGKSANEIREVLLSKAIDLGPVGFDYIFGYGRADALKSFNAICPDMNGDGIINILDMLWIASKLGPVTSEDVRIADINNDGQVNIMDLLEVEQNVSAS